MMNATHNLKAKQLRRHMMTALAALSLLLAAVGTASAHFVNTDSQQDVTPIQWDTSATGYDGEEGQQHTFQCPAGGSAENIFGSDIYTDDSSICTAAVHAGKIILSSGGIVTIEFRRGRSAYGSTTRHDITSNTYTSWNRSFVFVNQGTDKGAAHTSDAESVQTLRPVQQQPANTDQPGVNRPSSPPDQESAASGSGSTGSSNRRGSASPRRAGREVADGVAASGRDVVNSAAATGQQAAQEGVTKVANSASDRIAGLIGTLGRKKSSPPPAPQPAPTPAEATTAKQPAAQPQLFINKTYLQVNTQPQIVSEGEEPPARLYLLMVSVGNQGAADAGPAQLSLYLADTNQKLGTVSVPAIGARKAQVVPVIGFGKDDSGNYVDKRTGKKITGRVKLLLEPRYSSNDYTFDLKKTKVASVS